MKRIYRILMIVALTTSCGSKKKIITQKDKNESKPEIVAQIPQKKPVITTKPSTDLKLSATELYIQNYKDIAMEEMRVYKIPASITLAQGILESASGKGRLAIEANNHFGIKCHGWKGDKIYHDDDKRQECFRKYSHAKSSFEDHSKFLTTRSRYSGLFKLKQQDYKGWAKGLRAAGYATDRKYPEKLISLIERYQLYRYDQMVLGKTIPDSQTQIVQSSTTSSQTHTVVKGDTLYSLSRRYKTSVEELKRLNNLSSNHLSIGQVIIVKSN